MRRRAHLHRVLLVSAAFSGCEPLGPDSVDDDPQELLVVVAGSCAAGGAGSIVLRRTEVDGRGGDRVVVTSGATVDIPQSGAYGRGVGPLREGGFQLYGDMCLPNGRPCPPSAAGSRFRRCEAVRERWFIELRCTDGFGAATCSAQISE